MICSFPGVKALDVVAPNEVFTCAAGLTDAGYEVTIASVSGGSVRAESGLTLSTEVLPEKETIDTLVLPGGSGARLVRSNPTMMSWIAAASCRARRTVAIGSGTLLASAAGLLDGHRRSTQGSGTDQSGREIPVRTIGSGSVLFLRDSPPVWTTAGVAGGIDTVLRVVEEDYGADVANEVVRSLDLRGCGAGGPGQLAHQAWTPRAKHHAIRLAQEVIEADPSAKHTISELARRVALSPRHFARVFVSEVSETPGAYVERARINLAHRQLEGTTDTVATIAGRCGFGTAETMRRAFVRRTGVSPTEYRRRPDLHGGPASNAGAGADACFE